MNGLTGDIQGPRRAAVLAVVGAGAILTAVWGGTSFANSGAPAPASPSVSVVGHCLAKAPCYPPHQFRVTWLPGDPHPLPVHTQGVSNAH